MKLKTFFLTVLLGTVAVNGTAQTVITDGFSLIPQQRMM